jgi:hypothetical protein
MLTTRPDGPAISARRAALTPPEPTSSTLIELVLEMARLNRVAYVAGTSAACFRQLRASVDSSGMAP